MFKSGFNLPFIFLHLLILLFSCTTFAIRKDIGFLEKRICRNTVQGRYLLSDDNGHVCDALSVDPVSRCCPEKGDKFSCQGCDLLSQCCNSYEYCVSCCLNPSKTLKQHVLKMRVAKPATAGTYASVFDFCAGRCRHNSESVVSNTLNIEFSSFLYAVLDYSLHMGVFIRTCSVKLLEILLKYLAKKDHIFGSHGVFPYTLWVHENAYISDFHHCFSVSSNSLGANSTNLEARLIGINIVVGRQGESCDSVCKSNGQSCVPNKLPVLNQCDIIQKYMRCKGGCLASVGADQPAEVVDGAPKHLNPEACLFTRTQSMISCDGSHQHTRRLCPCA
ncbi:hypothetical protein FEM48_Zijuj07G0021700 [Ziziphus jujuba var. spinosa]|uniref:SREBP regulating gene protein n=1 Tax=Ziziphus jujuba var. spinosa TaxID=714518 RepID=A0A978V1U9_ZIZJJ|nr:hypothetical protein FEM48_Zijuj07G0021700 [Ziziphus jujuba var. spinosa]